MQVCWKQEEDEKEKKQMSTVVAGSSWPSIKGWVPRWGPLNLEILFQIKVQFNNILAKRHNHRLMNRVKLSVGWRRMKWPAGSSLRLWWASLWCSHGIHEFPGAHSWIEREGRKMGPPRADQMRVQPLP